MTTKTSSPKGNLMIIVATLIWGSGYIAQSSGMYHVAPLTFNAVRFAIGGTIALGPALFFVMRQRVTPPEEHKPAPISKSTAVAGAICGIVLCLAINLQQFGLLYTSVANASFITSLYVIMVPIASMIVFRKKPPVFVWISVVIAMVGIYFLSLSDGFYVNLGDILVLLCAITFTAQILLISHFSPKHNVIVMACVQFYVVSAISLSLAFIFETPSMVAIFAAAPYVLYTGVLSSGVAYILQMKAQKTTDATVAAVLFSFEGVVAAIVGWLVINQVLTSRELLGCGLIFIGILVAQMKQKKAATA
ncbi:MAG: DMT family transporter [Defluviitaleaceae bacterium]|nr:DMT family transporter [Defluviitaleaceae bacterium]